jgi:hypothetical protein
MLAGTRRVLTHCNTGALAAPGRGTALGVIAELGSREQLETVLATETRPLLQGGPADGLRAAPARTAARAGGRWGRSRFDRQRGGGRRDRGLRPRRVQRRHRQ